MDSVKAEIDSSLESTTKKTNEEHKRNKEENGATHSRFVALPASGFSPWLDYCGHVEAEDTKNYYFGEKLLPMPDSSFFSNDCAIAEIQFTHR